MECLESVLIPPRDGSWGPMRHLTTALCTLTLAAGLAQTSLAGDYCVTVTGTVQVAVPNPPGPPFNGVGPGTAFTMDLEVFDDPIMTPAGIFIYPIDTATSAVVVGSNTFAIAPGFGSVEVANNASIGDAVIAVGEIQTSVGNMFFGAQMLDATGSTINTVEFYDLIGMVFTGAAPSELQGIIGSGLAPPALVLDVAEIRIESCGGCAPIGTPFCTAVPNSTGFPALTRACGDDAVAANNVTLIASRLPQDSFGFFITSTTQGFTQMPGGSVGNLCLGGQIGRYVGPGQIQNSGAMGRFTLGLDLTQTPTPTGFAAVQPGETWNYTTWFRDSVGGVATSNFADGISVTFQ